ncbi:MAG: glutathione S-transferase family protein [Parvularculaceae bacterium]
MSAFILYIGDKNLSSWSLRAWLAMKLADVPFREHLIRLDEPETRASIGEHSPSGLVPCLKHGEIVVWDSLAIAEYLNDLFPEKGLWPAARAGRAHARAVSAEMHSGFAQLRTVWPMVFAREGMRHIAPPGVKRDIARIAEIWTECRTRFGAGGPFLFGGFTIADAMYAPVVSRFATYGPLDLSDSARAYMEAVRTLPAMREWGDGAKAEIAD